MKKLMLITLAALVLLLMIPVACGRSSQETTAPSPIPAPAPSAPPIWGTPPKEADNTGESLPTTPVERMIIREGKYHWW